MEVERAVGVREFNYEEPSFSSSSYYDFTRSPNLVVLDFSVVVILQPARL